MSEYSYVEKPFLDQLAALGWDVIDQGLGIPQDPAASGRSTFREVILTKDFEELAPPRPWETLALPNRTIER